MRYLSKHAAFFAGVALLSAAAMADPATQPTTQPAAPDFYLVPFTAIGNDNSLDWAGKAVAQNLLTDLARNKMRAVAADKSPADARATAKETGAKYLIAGTYQMNEQQVRFNGQITNVETGSVIGGISATGAVRDLFNLEDSLSSQTLQQLAQLPGTASNKPVPPALQPRAVVQVIQPPAVAQVGTASSYQGSALEQYVNSNHTPSTDYNQQVHDAQYRNTFGSYNNYGYGYGGYGGLYSPFYFGGGYGFGLTYSIHTGGYAGFGSGYGTGYYGGHHDHIIGGNR